MGLVYVAEHDAIASKLAVKVLRDDLANDADLVTRFMNEARAASAIRHPNIVDIIDAGRLPEGTAYILMEYLDGESLAARIRRTGRVEIVEAVAFASQVAGGLGAAHQRGIVHRDLKPGN